MVADKAPLVVGGPRRLSTYVGWNDDKGVHGVEVLCIYIFVWSSGVGNHHDTLAQLVPWSESTLILCVHCNQNMLWREAQRKHAIEVFVTWFMSREQ